MKQVKEVPVERYKSIILKHVYTYKILDFLFVYTNWLLKKCLWFSNVEIYIYISRYIPVTTVVWIFHETTQTTLSNIISDKNKICDCESLWIDKCPIKSQQKSQLIRSQRKHENHDIWISSPESCETKYYGTNAKKKFFKKSKP